MKRVYSIIVLVFLSLIVAACNQVETKSNTIVNATLTDRENMILSTLASQSFVFDFDIASDYGEVSAWVEKYEFGKLVEKQVSSLITTVEKNGTIIFAVSETENEKIFNIGVGDKDGSGSVSNTTPYPADLSSVWGSFSESKTITKEELVLASIGYSSDEFGISSLTNDFYDDPEAHIGELEEYDVAYLLKVKFEK